LIIIDKQEILTASLLEHTAELTLTYKKIDQIQLEQWLINPVTKAYFQSIYWSNDQLKEVQGNGGTFNVNSMEKTFVDTALYEGKKQGYECAMDVFSELNRFDFLEDGIDVDIPDFKDIAEEE